MRFENVSPKGAKAETATYRYEVMPMTTDNLTWRLTVRERAGAGRAVASAAGGKRDLRVLAHLYDADPYVNDGTNRSRLRRATELAVELDPYAKYAHVWDCSDNNKIGH